MHDLFTFVKILMMIDSFVNYVQFLLSVVTLVLIAMLYLDVKKWNQKSNTNSNSGDDSSRRLQLQALERLTLFAERSGLKNLVTRLGGNGMSASAFHQQLVDTIKSEYEYNLSQQIYVSPEIWNAITRLKDQNIYVINHITANLHHDASGLELGNMLIEYTMTPNAEMHLLVLDALQFEAKKILQ